MALRRPPWEYLLNGHRLIFPASNLMTVPILSPGQARQPVGGRKAAPGLAGDMAGCSIGQSLPEAGWSLASPGPWLPGKILYGAEMPWMRGHPSV